MVLSKNNFERWLLYFVIRSFLLAIFLAILGDFIFNTIILQWNAYFIKQWIPIFIILVLWISITLVLKILTIILASLFPLQSGNKTNGSKRDEEKSAGKRLSAHKRLFGRKNFPSRIICFIFIIFIFYIIYHTLVTGQIPVPCKNCIGPIKYISYADKPMGFIAAFIVYLDVVIWCFILGVLADE